MAREEHDKAADHHENAAKSHRAAAQHHGQAITRRVWSTPKRQNGIRRRPPSGHVECSLRDFSNKSD